MERFLNSRGKQKTKDPVSELENEIRFLKKGIQLAYMNVKEGNQELGKAMKGKALN